MTDRIISPTLTLRLYDSIRELPADLYQKAKAYEIMAAELPGSEVGHKTMLDRAEQFAITGLLAEHQEQMNNYHIARQLTKAGFQAAPLEFACYVQSANRLSLTDYEEEPLQALISAWSGQGLTQGLIDETLVELKEKLRAEVGRYFPRQLQKGQHYNQLTQIKQFLRADLAYRRQPDEQTYQAMLAAQRTVLQHHPVLCFRDTEDNVITKLEKEHLKTQVALAKADCPDPARLSLFEYYGWLEQLQAEYDAQVASMKPTAKAKR